MCRYLGFRDVTSLRRKKSGHACVIELIDKPKQRKLKNKKIKTHPVPGHLKKELIFKFGLTLISSSKDLR